MSRQTVREELVTLFIADDSFNQVLGYAPVETQGMDKILAIFTRDTHHQQLSNNWETHFYTFVLDVYIKRSGGETVEDTLDELHEAIRSVVSANQGNTNWEYLSLEDPSNAYFAEISGVSHRVESHKLNVKEI